QPLSLKASLVFEQSYGGIEGDSASSTELYALLSAISGAPIKQGMAVTGSVNQFGEIQAIGGVNEKIEGFFDVCHNKGLTGDQGVLSPEANVKHLMLRKDVVAAIENEKFHIYPVKTVDEGMELLTGVPAGEPDENNRYPEKTINGMVQQRLAKMAENMRQFSKGMEQGGQRESGE
ncbi:MAG: S16 family serine protease, partial [Desulfobacterales bacterium]